MTLQTLALNLGTLSRAEPTRKPDKTLTPTLHPARRLRPARDTWTAQHQYLTALPLKNVLFYYYCFFFFIRFSICFGSGLFLRILVLILPLKAADPRPGLMIRIRRFFAKWISFFSLLISSYRLNVRSGSVVFKSVAWNWIHDHGKIYRIRNP